MLLSVLVPVYNEAATIVQVIDRIFAQAWPTDLEVIVVDDCSRDGTRDILKGLENSRPGLTIRYHPENRGKGAALRTALAAASGEVVAVQDADLEYDPADLIPLLQPIILGGAEAVYGSRFLAGRASHGWHRLGNRIITLVSNFFTGQKLTDMETCYKVVLRRHLAAMKLRSNRFGIEPEITAKLSRRGVRIIEMPISYHYRTYAEGKKINWRDGVKAILAIIYFTFAD